MSKASWKITPVLIAVAVIAFVKYNSISNMEESFIKQWAIVEYQCQRRADIIPKLVRRVKVYANHEKEVFESVAKAKAIAANMNIDPSSLINENISKFQDAQNDLNSALTSLLDLAVVYPELPSDQQFLELIAKLEGEENRIAVQSRRFNEQVKLYNAYILKFPNNLIARLLGFERQVTFKANEIDEIAP